MVIIFLIMFVFFFSSRRRHTRCALVTGVQTCALPICPSPKNAMLRLYIDAASGITLEDCERVSKEVAGVMDVEDPIRNAYRLEVSSPGLDRPLVKPAHFQRFVGQQRSEENTSELQSLMRITYAVFCLKKKKIKIH